MRILIAEDDAVSRLILEKTLTAWGHEVIVASDGGAAKYRNTSATMPVGRHSKPPVTRVADVSQARRLATASPNPTPSERTQANANPPATLRTVSPARSAISSRTGRPSDTETPQSPRARPAR